MKVAIIGYSTLEQSESVDAYKYYRSKGDDVTIYYWLGNTTVDDLPKDVKTVECRDNHTFENLDEFDLVVRGPGIHPKFLKTSSRVTTTINEFMGLCPAPMIGVTGTKGKGTTSTLITKMLQADGKTAHLGGNIGVPVLNMLSKIKPEDYVVLELSSFQLIDATNGTQTAVCVMVVPEHLDWHSDVEEYLSAKSNLFKNQTDKDLAVFNADNENSRKIASVSKGNKIAYSVNSSDSEEIKSYIKNDAIYYQDTKVCDVSDVALLGQHNLENVCAAIAAVWPHINGNTDAITQTVKSFTGLEHRLEKVREFNGVTYYDDSFATTPETAMVAIRAFDQPVILIAGGHPKGIPFDELADEIVKRQVKHVLAIGTAGPEIATLLQKKGYTSVTTEGLVNMKEIISSAQKLAKPGDVVLLSTACASFDMFKNYKDRGDQFKQAVRELF